MAVTINGTTGIITPDIGVDGTTLTIDSVNNRVGIGSEAPRYPLEVNSGNLLVSGSTAGNLILEDRGVGDSSRPFALLASDGGNFTITNANRNPSGTTTSSVERLRIDVNGRLTFSNSEGIQLSAKTSSLYTLDGSLSYYGATNAVYLNGAGTDGWLRLNASGAENNQNAINIFGAGAGAYITMHTGNGERLRVTSTGKLEAYKGTSTTGKVSGSEAFTVGNGAGNHRFAVYPDGSTVIGGQGLIGNYNILLQNDGQSYFGARMKIGTTTEGEANADDLTVATSGHTGMTIRSGTENRGNIYFSDGTSGDAEYRGYVTYDHDGDRFKFGTANADRLVITSAGKIGFGVASPAEMMEITNTVSTGSQIQFRDTSTGTGAGDGARFGYNGSGAQIWNFENTYIRFATSNVERLRIDSDGQATFDKGAPASANQVIARFQAESSRRLDIVWHDSGSYMGFDIPGTHDYIFKCAGSKRLRITSAGLFGIGHDSPTAFGRMTVAMPSQSGGAAIQVANSSNGSGDGSTTNVVLRSVNNSANQWADAEYRASQHWFSRESDVRLGIRQHYIRTGGGSQTSNNGYIPLTFYSSQTLGTGYKHGISTTFLGQISPGNAGNSYLHVKIDVPGGAMWWLHSWGYTYAGGAIHNSQAVGYTYGSSIIASSVLDENSNRALHVYRASDNNVVMRIYTAHGTTNAWGYFAFEGGFDGICGNKPDHTLRILAYTWSSSSAAQY